LLTDDDGRQVFQQQRRIETIVVDEELLITGVSVSEENSKSVERWCFSIREKWNILNSGVSVL
jgi:hypothetical protein